MAYAARIRVALVVIAFVLDAFAVLAAPRGTALVMGNASYENAHLANPINDAADIAQVLRRSGFEVIVETDVDQSEMESVIRRFGQRLKGNRGPGLFYYAGHAVEFEGRTHVPGQANNVYIFPGIGLAATALRMRRIISIPAVMLPHCSLPPICMRHPNASKRCRKSYA